jgi:hypothetical protein
MSTGGRTRRDSNAGTAYKKSYVNTTKKKVAPRNRDRAATFVKTEDVRSSSTKSLTGTLNPVTRTKLKQGDDRPIVGTDGTVFFKRHDDNDAPAQYAVASTRLARFLGIPNVIAHNAFAHINNADGAVAGRVPGKPLISWEYKRERKRPAWIDKSSIPDWVRSEQLIKRGNTYYTRSAALNQWVDYADPRIQKGLSDLQLFDAISGQIDRHAGNIYVDATTGAVTGIDDDKSFGNGQSPDDVVGDRKRDHYLGLPKLVDESTANAILDLDPEDLPGHLEAALSDPKALNSQEIADAQRRLAAVKTYLQDLKDRGALVSEWNDDTYTAAAQDLGGSYLGRQVATLADAFTGRVENKGQYNEYSIRVVGAPKGVVTTVPAPPTTTWTAQRPGQQPRPARNVLGQARNAPPQPSSASTRAVPTTTTTTTERINRLKPVAPRRQPPPESTTTTGPDAPIDSPSIAATRRLTEDDDETLPTVESHFSFERVALTGNDRVYLDTGGDDDTVSDDDMGTLQETEDDSDQIEKDNRSENIDEETDPRQAQIDVLTALLNQLKNA